MPVACSKDFVLRNQGASIGKDLQRFNLFLQSTNKLIGRFGTILRDKTPSLFDIIFRRKGDAILSAILAA
jgi:hypothetical protein